MWNCHSLDSEDAFLPDLQRSFGQDKSFGDLDPSFKVTGGFSLKKRHIEPVEDFHQTWTDVLLR